MEIYQQNNTTTKHLKTNKIMKQLEMLMLENQIAMMQAIYDMSELSNSKMEELREQINKSKELLKFNKK